MVFRTPRQSGGFGQDELTDDIDIELDLVGLQDTDQTLEELTRQFLPP